MPGVFVAGDVRARSIKRVASAVGEGSMAVSLIHEYLAAGMSTTAAVTVADLRPVDLFDDLDDAQLARVGGGRAAPHFEPGELLAEQGVDCSRASTACSRARRRP